MLSLESASLEGAPLLAPISDHISPGQLLAIVGPNGAGKSTLLGLLSGFRQPDHGRVCLEGRELALWTVATLATRRALVAQQERPAFAWPLRDLVALGAHCSDDDIDRTLQELELDTLATRSVLTLSGGELQRVMIARALCQLKGPQPGPRYLLLDEPTSALDIGQQQNLMRLLRRQTRCTELAVICVLHDLNLASRFADRVWLMDRGCRIDAGPPTDVLRAERLAPIYRAELDDITCGDAGSSLLAIRR